MAKNAAVDLSKYDVEELESLKKRVDKEIDIRKQQRRDDALNQIRAIAGKAGFSLDELVSGGRSRRRGGAAVKYRDPKDPSKTWAGRGRKPRWLEKALADGRKLDEFKV